MFRPGTDPDQVELSDVLCDFCAKPWAEDVPFIEGHRGRHICGACLAAGYRRVVLERGEGPTVFECVLCREAAKDRAALDREDEVGWASSNDGSAAICRRCLKQAAGVLHKDPDYEWTRPE